MSIRDSDGDKAIRTGTAAVVTAVAGFGAVQSYNHIYDLARGHGQSDLDARLLPLSVDGLILAASLVRLHQALRRDAMPARAWLMLGLGVLATLAANVASGLPHGWMNAVISAWPAVAFVGAVEIDMWMIRKARPEAVVRPVSDPALGAVPSSVLEAAKASMAATLAAGNPWSVNQLQQQFSLTRAQAAKVRQAALAQANGHGADPVTGEEGITTSGKAPAESVAGT